MWLKILVKWFFVRWKEWRSSSLSRGNYDILHVDRVSLSWGTKNRAEEWTWNYQLLDFNNATLFRSCIQSFWEPSAARRSFCPTAWLPATSSGLRTPLTSLPPSSVASMAVASWPRMKSWFLGRTKRDQKFIISFKNEKAILAGIVDLLNSSLKITFSC